RPAADAPELALPACGAGHEPGVFLGQPGPRARHAARQLHQEMSVLPAQGGAQDKTAQALESFHQRLPEDLPPARFERHGWVFQGLATSLATVRIALRWRRVLVVALDVLAVVARP